MINIRQAVLMALRSDADLVTALAPVDEDGEVKVYKIPVKKNVAVPYITVQTVPYRGVTPVYGDSEVFEIFIMNMAVWAQTPALAWVIVPTMDDAMKAMDPTLPNSYELRSVQRYQSPFEIQEPDSNLFEVVVQYELMASR